MQLNVRGALRRLYCKSGGIRHGGERTATP